MFMSPRNDRSSSTITQTVQYSSATQAQTNIEYGTLSGRMLLCPEMWYSMRHGRTGRMANQSYRIRKSLYQKHPCQRLKFQGRNQAANRKRSQRSQRMKKKSKH